MELTTETKNNLELLDRILKYVKPSLLMEIADKARYFEYSPSRTTNELIIRIDGCVSALRMDLQRGSNDITKATAIGTIVFLLKLIEMIDKNA